MKPFIFILTSIGLFSSLNAQASKAINQSEKWLSISPTILFLLILFMVFIKLRKDKVSLKDLLLDKDANIHLEVQKTEQLKELTKPGLLANANAAQALKNLTDPGNPENAKNNTSVSRFLAFISGLVSVGLACTITSFFMWNYFDNEANTLDLNKLLTVLLSLGIGVIPYAFNKIGSAIK